MFINALHGLAMLLIAGGSATEVYQLIMRKGIGVLILHHRHRGQPCGRQTSIDTP